MEPTQVLQKILDRPEDANKYDFGHVLIIGGSPGMVGAPLIAGEAALRTGAGLATIASSPGVVDKLERRVEELMTLRLPISEPAAIRETQQFIAKRKVSAVILGPGLNEAWASLVRKLLPALQIPVVVDAGALTALQDHLAILPKCYAPILTPHAGEYAKLIGQTVSDDYEALCIQIVAFAQTYKSHLVLKGRHTLVAHPDGSVYKNQTGNPGLATAGTGDVLSGIIAGLLAQGIQPGEAAEAGVYLHGRAGDLAAKAETQVGIIASDLADFIPDALRSLLL